MDSSSKRSKRVSWAADSSLCQVQLFLSEDAPCVSSLGSQDHLQTKTSWLWHSSAVDSHDHLPPGFERPVKHVKIVIADIPMIKWQHPCMFTLNAAWLVVAGEESEEMGLQNQRQRGVLEAIYPRASSIPPNPFPPEAVNQDHGDEETLLVPVTAIEEEDDEEELDPPRAVLVPCHTSTSGFPNTAGNLAHTTSPPNLPNFEYASTERRESPAISTLPSSTSVPVNLGPTSSVQPDIAAAASAALTAIASSGDNGSLIDHGLLMKIFSDPKMIEKLVSDYGTPRQPPVLQPSVPIPPSPASLQPQAQPMQMGGPTAASSASVQHLYHNPNTVHLPINNQPVPLIAKQTTEPTIQQYGRDNQAGYGALPLHNVGNEGYRQTNTTVNDFNGGVRPMRKRDYREKIAKPCVYFGTPRGCIHGTNCLYIHDASLAQKIDRRAMKRNKFDGEFL